MSEDTQDREALITLTSDIVAAHVSNNNVPIDQVPTLIASVFQALEGLGGEPVVEEAPLEPAVSIRASVRPDHVTCLECGKKMKMLKRHLGTEHNLTTEEYRQRWGLPADHPLVAPNYASQRADLAKKIGLGRKPEAVKPVPKAKVGAKPKVEKVDAGAKAKAQPKTKVASEAKPKGGRKLKLRFKDAGAASTPEDAN